MRPRKILHMNDGRLKVFFILSLFFSIIIPLPAFGDIYKWVDEAGIIHFTNTPSDKKFQRIMKERKDSTLKQVQGKTQGSRSKSSKISPNPVFSYTEPVSGQDYSGLIQSISEKYQIDPALVRAIIKAESNFRSDAISRKGARGLMQLMPQTAYELNVKNSFDPEENIDGGVRYLKYLLDIFNGNLTLSLAAYNAGPELVQRLGRVPSIKETRDYVKRVLNFYSGTGIINKEPIYKIIFDDGTTIFTNTPYTYYSSNKGYMERM